MVQEYSLIGTMLRTLHLDGINRVKDLVADLSERNPLKVKDELVRKHGFYEHKVRQLLLAAAWGMRPAKQWNGRQSAVNGYIMVDAQGRMVLYSQWMSRPSPRCLYPLYKVGQHPHRGIGQLPDQTGGLSSKGKVRF